jgi:hypothetical protein
MSRRRRGLWIFAAALLLLLSGCGPLIGVDASTAPSGAVGAAGTSGMYSSDLASTSTTAPTNTNVGADGASRTFGATAGVFAADSSFVAAAEEGLTWAEQSGILRDAAEGTGNFGLGSATASEADALGRAWVGEGYTVASDGKTLVSADGLRQYRPPSFKPNLGIQQANFERRFPGQLSQGWQGNGHLNITGP